MTARHERLLAWLSKHSPDVLCLQELKAVDERFPRESVEALGYHVATHGQRTYNGVAVLAREPLCDLQKGFDDGDDDSAARMLSVRCGAVHILSCYVPNGQTVDSPKFSYKLRWLDRLNAYLAHHHSPSDSLLVCGDFNIAPEDIDCHDPKALRDDVLCHPAVRERWRALMQFGLVDTYRLHVPDAGKYSWWDYRMLGFPKNRGLRIDFVLATAPLATRCTAVHIDRDERKGKLPSDHAPVIAEFDLSKY